MLYKIAAALMLTGWLPAIAYIAFGSGTESPVALGLLFLLANFIALPLLMVAVGLSLHRRLGHG